LAEADVDVTADRPLPAPAELTYELLGVTYVVGV
jgi:hypothetical protein